MKSRTLLYATLLALAPWAEAGLGAQTIRGRTVDAENGGPVPRADVLVEGVDGFQGKTTSDSTGSFGVRVPGGGRYLLSVKALGYRPVDSSVVVVERSWQQVEIVVRLSASPLEIEGISVVARGLDLRHRATLGGFRERHQESLSVGSARVVSSRDPEMTTSFDVGDVLKWFPVKKRKCVVVYIDGKVAPGWSPEVDLLTVEGLAGLEFYLNALDAPLEFRGGGPPCLRSSSFSVLALWREPQEGGPR